VAKAVQVTISTTPQLPGIYLIGHAGKFILPNATTTGRMTIDNGVFLGLGSSQEDQHNLDTQPERRGHPGREYAAKEGERCSACRWIEIRLFRFIPEESRQSFYIVHTTGQTIVPGESPKYTLHKPTPSADTVGEILTVVNRENKPMLSRPARMVLSCAAKYDESIAEFWDTYVADRSGVSNEDR
jgi:hypothetical protein